MADEISIQINSELINGSVIHRFDPDTLIATQSTARFIDKILDIGTSEESITFDDFTTEGYVFLQNLDSSNYVQWGPDSTGQVTIGKLNAGDIAFFRMEPTATLKMTANTASCKVRVIGYEN